MFCFEVAVNSLDRCDHYKHPLQASTTSIHYKHRDGGRIVIKDHRRRFPVSQYPRSALCTPGTDCLLKFVPCCRGITRAVGADEIGTERAAQPGPHRQDKNIRLGRCADLRLEVSCGQQRFVLLDN